MAILLAMAGFAGEAAAQSDPPQQMVTDKIVIVLQQKGYRDILVTRTWLGRLRVVGWIDGRAREIIVHPTSGEVLRDFLDPIEVEVEVEAGGGNDSDGVGAARRVTDFAEIIVDLEEGEDGVISAEITMGSGLSAEQVDGYATGFEP
ncbi:MAG: PepSY domain-containing protein [Fuscovulum sp.]|nr:MAG: PepSY domain-containing protein [Fuscovulum sp.]